MLKLVNNLLLSRSGSDSLRVRVSLFVISKQHLLRTLVWHGVDAQYYIITPIH